MKNRIISICFLLTILISCSVIKKNETINKIDNNTHLELQNNNDFLLVADVIKQNNITDFFFVEIMNGNEDLSFHRDKYEVIDIFGEPLDINVTEVLFNLAGGKVIEMRELIYDDFVHIYYVFESGIVFYIGFNIEKRLERLKTINIGDTSDKLLSTFSDEYYSSENVKENISYYTDPVTYEIQFIIRDTIIQKIFVNFLLI
ncbi:MAG: hypothetical protein LBQ93_10980 [Treponema sp.]|jgi:hypothetical protein|nr:hypothetical protein [Treponema sp.]